MARLRVAVREGDQRRCEVGSRDLHGLAGGQRAHRVSDVGGVGGAGLARQRARDRTRVDDLPGLRIDHQRFCNARDAEAFADQLRVIHQHGDVEVQRLHVGDDRLALQARVRAEQEQLHARFLEGRMQVAERQRRIVHLRRGVGVADDHDGGGVFVVGQQVRPRVLVDEAEVLRTVRNTGQHGRRLRGDDLAVGGDAGSKHGGDCNGCGQFPGFHGRPSCDFRPSAGAVAWGFSYRNRGPSAMKPGPRQHQYAVRSGACRLGK